MTPTHRLERQEWENRYLKRAGMAVLAVLVAAVLIGQARRPRATPITNPTERLEFQGFSILPPRGERWFIVEPQAAPVPPWKWAVVFFKVVAKIHSIHAWVMTTDLRYVADVTSKSRTELLQDLASAGLEYENPRFKPIDVKTSLDECLGYDCVRYKQVVEVHSPRDFSGSVLIMIREGFIVPLPHSPTSYIWFEYSQRFPRGQKPFPIEAELEPFLTSLAFTPPR